MICSARFPNKFERLQVMNYREKRQRERAIARDMALIPREGVTVQRCKPGKASGLVHGFTNYAVRGRTFVTSNAAAAQKSCAFQIYSCELVKA
jgi:hypothetical protein